jgi:hypothetical protein
MYTAFPTSSHPSNPMAPWRTNNSLASHASSTRPLPPHPYAPPQQPAAAPYLVPGAPAAQQQQYYARQQPVYQQQAFAQTAQPLANPQAAYIQPPYALSHNLHAGQALPRPQRPQFIAPNVPPLPPLLTPQRTQYPVAQPYQTAPLDPRAGIPTSASEYIASGPVPKVFPLSTTGWKEEQKLALERNNWLEFSSKVENQLGMTPGAARFLYVDPSDPNPCPSWEMYPNHHRAWKETNHVVLSFLREVLTVTERSHIANCALASDAWAALRYRHLARGPAGQVAALKRFANISYASDPTTFAATTELLTQTNTSIWQCGPPNPELFLLSGIITALEANHPTIASTLLAQPTLTLNMALATLDTKSGREVEIKGGEAYAASAPDQLCTNNACPKPKTHTWPYCTSKGGGMAGKTVFEAVNKHRVDNGKQPLVQNQSKPKGAGTQGQAVKRDATGRAYITLQGTDFYLSAPETANLADATSSLMTDQLPGDDGDHLGKFEAWLAQEEPHVSIDFNELLPFAGSAQGVDDFELYADSGANIHISSCRSDFATFKEIAPRPIRGFQGSSINATGIGTIITNKFTLEYALYVPGAKVRLLSVLRLCQSKKYTFHFDDRSAWITDSAQALICTGSVSPTKNLYRLDCHPTPLAPLSANVVDVSPSVRDLRHWHLCLGHANHQAVSDAYTQGRVDGMDLDPSTDAPICDDCILGKQARTNVPKRPEGLSPPTTRRLERVHMDLSGRILTTSRSGNQYTFDIVDAHTSRGFSYPVPNKSSCFAILRAWQLETEARTGERVGTFIIDNGELKSDEFIQWCPDRGTAIVFTPPHVSKLNGVAERFHRTIHGTARAMRVSCGAPPNLWDEFCVTAAYLHARTPSRAQGGKTPHEGFEKLKPNLKHLREIGCRAFVLIEGHNPKVFERSLECVLIGYVPNCKAYRCWQRTTGKIFNSGNVRFIEQGQTVHVKRHGPDPQRPLSPANRGVPDDQSTIDPKMTTSILPTVSDPVPFVDPPPCVPVPVSEAPSGPRRSERVRRPAVHHAAGNSVDDDGEMAILEGIEDAIEASPEDDDGVEALLLAQINAYMAENPINVEFPDDPRNYREAMAAPDAEKWVAGTHEELKALRDLGVYELVPPSVVPLNKTILDLKPVYTRKRNERAEVVRNKVRYCALGDRQKYGRDYEQTTSPTARLESFRAVLHVGASRGWDIQQVDIKTAFLNAPLPPDEVQYTRQPRHFEEPGKEDWLWKLVMALYGLKQAGRAWNRAMHEAMLEWGFRRLLCEWCVYVRVVDGVTNLVAVHVDDMLCAASEAIANVQFKDQLRSKWNISDLGEVAFCLGIAVVRDPERRTVSLSQTALIDRLVSQFHQLDADTVRTPMEHKLPLERPSPTAPPLSREEMEHLAATPYRSLVMSMMYIALGTRPDISYAITKLAQFLDCYNTSHWQAAIRVLRYLKGTRTMSLTLGGHNPISLSGHTDSDFANDAGRKSVMGYCFSLGSGAISWSSRKQKVVALSSTESEYISASEGAKDACWLRMLARGLTVSVTTPTDLFVDNNSAIILANDQSLHIRAKHIDIRYHHIRDCTEKKKLRILRVPTENNTADTFTKALPFPAFIRHRASLGVA